MAHIGEEFGLAAAGDFRLFLGAVQRGLAAFARGDVAIGDDRAALGHDAAAALDDAAVGTIAVDDGQRLALDFGHALRHFRLDLVGGMP